MPGSSGSKPGPGGTAPALAATPSEAMGMGLERGLSVGSTGPGRGTARYRLVAGIAKGGMGEVYLALEEGRGAPKKVIIKRLLAELRENKEYREMFRFEADVLTRLSHPNIVAMLDLPLIDGVPCIALEYVHGRSLARLMERLFELDRRFPVAMAGTVLLHVLEALQHAHDVKLTDGSSLELVHRDVTPGNILLSFAGEVKLTDFGIAKGKTAAFSTTAGIVKGKARYLSPEQILGERATPRSDVFSAACVGVEMLSGTPLFERAAVPKTLEAIVQGLRPSLAELLPPEAAMLIPVLERGLARDPSFRYPSAKLMGEALRSALLPLGGPTSSQTLGAFVGELFAGSEEPWEKLLERPTAVEAENPIMIAPVDREATVRDPGPELEPTADDRVAEARVETMIVREREHTQRDRADRQATVLEGEEETIHLAAQNPLEVGKATEVMVPAVPEPETPVAPEPRPDSAVLRLTLPKDAEEHPTAASKGRSFDPVRPVSFPPPALARTTRVSLLGHEAPLFAVVLFIFAVGALSGVVVTKVVKSNREGTIVALEENTQPELVVPPPMAAPVPELELEPEPIVEEAAEPEAAPEKPVVIPGVLTFVYPKGARVRLDGRWLEDRIPVRVEASDGRHEVEVQSKKRRYRLSVEVKDGETVTVDRRRLLRSKR